MCVGVLLLQRRKEDRSHIEHPHPAESANRGTLFYLRRYNVDRWANGEQDGSRIESAGEMLPGVGGKGRTREFPNTRKRDAESFPSCNRARSRSCAFYVFVCLPVVGGLQYALFSAEVSVRRNKTTESCRSLRTLKTRLLSWPDSSSCLPVRSWSGPPCVFLS